MKKTLIIFLLFSCQTRNSEFYQNQANSQQYYQQEYRDPTTIISTMPASENPQNQKNSQ